MLNASPGPYRPPSAAVVPTRTAAAADSRTSWRPSLCSEAVTAYGRPPRSNTSMVLGLLRTLAEPMLNRAAAPSPSPPRMRYSSTVCTEFKAATAYAPPLREAKASTSLTSQPGADPAGLSVPFSCTRTSCTPLSPSEATRTYARPSASNAATPYGLLSLI